ncbi:sugar kinase [Longispora fulva]|uniref:Putative NBD/HSP70 family sugar kinase n=1 Tax=Longispora fulva TaxID=619741 RepID=A0A8J7KFC4_9ACTN|nr:ROK family transcriptional regulator [Longispora fulva]MBG6136005.1 putative NBD/HSP70 family sugar kinase [Longispora fulva]GIG55754.1 sugar kinase [Longispora fulva]
MSSRQQGVAAVGQDSEAMRRRNESAVLRTVLAHGAVARAEIARHAGLSAPSVTKVVVRLIEAGALRELAPQASAELGRPRVPLTLEGTAAVALGVHIGLLRTTIGLVGLDGTVRAQVALPHEIQPEPLVAQAADAVDAFLAEHLGDQRLVGTGVSIGGWVDEDAGVVVEHPALGWTDVPLLAMLRDKVPGPIRLGQNTRATAQAEMWFGAGRDVHDLALVFVGNVVGVATVVGGVIQRGPRSAAGSVDHAPVDGGTLQSRASDTAVLAEARAQGLPVADFDAVVDLARAGDATADAILRTRARYVGRAVAMLADLLNPSRIVLAGGVVAIPAHVDEVRAEASARAHRLAADLGDRILPTTFGEGSLVVSSAAALLEDLLADPLAFLEEPR